MHYRKKQELEPQIQTISDQKPAINQFCPDFSLIFKETHALICKLHLLVTQDSTYHNLSCKHLNT